MKVFCLIISLNFFSFLIQSQVIVSFGTPGIYLWSCPQNVSQFTVQCWGAGGGGGNNNYLSVNFSNGGSGGGGGAFSEKTFNVVQNNNYFIYVGNGGMGAPAFSTTSAQNGGNSWFNINNAVPLNDSYVLAKGGGNGFNNSSTNPNNGGLNNLCFGDIKISGNSGNSGTTTGGGNGGNAANNGGNGGIGSAIANGSNGFPPGGGGGGSNDSQTYQGGRGGDGLVKIIYYFDCTGTPQIPNLLGNSNMGCGYLSLWANGFGNSPGLQFQWQTSSTLNGPWTDVQNVNDTILNYNCTSDTYFQLKVTCAFSGQTVTSNIFYYDFIQNSCSINSDQTICNDTQPIPLLSTGAVGTLQWQYASSINGPWTSIIGATSSTLSSSQMGNLTSTRYFRLAATNGQCSTIYSNNITISVSQPSVSGTISSNQNVCMGNQPLNISLSSFNGTIQWQESSNIIGPFSNIGNGSNSLTGSQVGSIISNKYIRAQVTSTGCPSTTSNILTITALTLPAISAGSDVSICNGDSIILNGSGGLSYQWSNNVVNGQPFVPQSTTAFTVVGIGSNGCSNTDNIVVNVLALPNFTLNYSLPAQICQGSSYTITANTSSNVSYQWYKNNQLIIGATNNSISVNQTGIYKVRITSNSTGCQKYSNSVNLTVLPVPNLYVLGNTNICSEDTAFLYAVSNGNVIWNGTLTQPSYQLSPTISTPFSVVSIGSNGCVSSYNDTIQVYYPTDTTINISSYGPLALNGYNYGQSGTYIQNLSSVYGCDSSVTINLYVYTNEIDETILTEISITNPVLNNLLSINKNNNPTFNFISVVDCTGRKVNVELLFSTQSEDEYLIDVKPGIYYLYYELNRQFKTTNFFIK